MTRRSLWGAAAIAAYLAAAGITFGSGLVPVRPLYDGLAPPIPYRWVHPPPDLAPENVPPEQGRASIGFTEEGLSESRSVSTPEGQAIVIFRQGGIATAEGAEEIVVTITPLAPPAVPEPPDDLRIDGNLYRVQAVYHPSGEEAELTDQFSVVLRYPQHGSVVLRLVDGAWQRLATEVAAGSFQLFVQARELGDFAAAGIPETGLSWQPFAIAVAAVAAAAGGYLAGRRRVRRPQSRQQRRARRRGAGS